MASLYDQFTKYEGFATELRQSYSHTTECTIISWNHSNEMENNNEIQLNYILINRIICNCLDFPRSAMELWNGHTDCFHSMTNKNNCRTVSNGNTLDFWKTWPEN